jgi:hypothetical protein
MNKHRAWIQFLSLVIIASFIYILPISKNFVGSSIIANAYPPPLTPYPTSSNPQSLHIFNLPLIMSGPPPAPTAALSRYMSRKDLGTYYNLGRLQAQAGLQDAVVIIDFGNPKYDGINYGTILKNYNETIPATINEIEAASKEFLRGYHENHINGTRLTLAIGTTNEGLDVTMSSDHGSQWAQMVIRIDSYISSWADHEAVAAAIDIEMNWNNPTVTKDWVNGYDGVAGRKNYYNFGTCDSCSNIFFDWTPPFPWTKDDIWFVSYGPTSAYTLPEIYDSYLNQGINASQWQRIKEYGITCTNNCLPSQYPYSGYRGIYFLGSLTQYDACNDDYNNPKGAPECRANGQDNSPSTGWQLFWTALNRAPTVTQQNLKWSTDMSWKN